MHWKNNNLLRCKVGRVLEAVSGFTNPLSSSFEDNELYFLSFGVLAKPGIAKLITLAGRLLQSSLTHFCWKSVFHNPIKCYKLIQFWCLPGQEEIVQLVWWELKGASLVSMTFILDIMLTLSWHCRSFWDMYHGNCLLLIKFPPKLTSLNFCMSCNSTLNQH